MQSIKTKSNETEILSPWHWKCSHQNVKLASDRQREKKKNSVIDYVYNQIGISIWLLVLLLLLLAFDAIYIWIGSFQIRRYANIWNHLHKWWSGVNAQTVNMNKHRERERREWFSYCCQRWSSKVINELVLHQQSRFHIIQVTALDSAYWKLVFCSCCLVVCWLNGPVAVIHFTIICTVYSVKWFFFCPQTIKTILSQAYSQMRWLTQFGHSMPTHKYGGKWTGVLMEKNQSGVAVT